MLCYEIVIVHNLNDLTSFLQFKDCYQITLKHLFHYSVKNGMLPAPNNFEILMNN